MVGLLGNAVSQRIRKLRQRSDLDEIGRICQAVRGLEPDRAWPGW